MGALPLRNPLRWPAAWRAAGPLLPLLEASPFRTLIGAPGALTAAGFEVTAEPPAAVTAVAGRWPGVRGGQDDAAADAGPTGAPWVDANGWIVCLERALAPDREVWVDCEIPARLPRTAPRELALVEAAMYGGRWPVNLPPDLAEGIAGGQSAALAVWRRMADATRFFGQHADWPRFEPVAVLGVVSDFAGPSRFLSREVLNLTSRLHQPFRILDASRLSAGSLDGLQAVVFPDAAAPGQSVRAMLTGFAESGGLLVVGARWGDAHDGAEGLAHPRYGVWQLGKGRLAVARRAMNDPYLVANDVRVLLSSRHDPVRFWNGGSLGSFYTRPPEGPAVVQIVNYATHPDRYPPSLRVAGDFRTARLWTIGADAQPLEIKRERGGVEILLPPVEVYCAVELR